MGNLYFESVESFQNSFGPNLELKDKKWKN
jgi:hypothetical protein